jgi:hypothetical protein
LLAQSEDSSVFQVGRNALQRGVMSSSGPWGATLVRFLFGLPLPSRAASGSELCWSAVPTAKPERCIASSRAAVARVRFLFGLPFSILFVTVGHFVMPGADLHWSGAFWLSDPVLIDDQAKQGRQRQRTLLERGADREARALHRVCSACPSRSCSSRSAISSCRGPIFTGAALSGCRPSSMVAGIHKGFDMGAFIRW